MKPSRKNGKRKKIMLSITQDTILGILRDPEKQCPTSSIARDIMGARLSRKETISEAKFWHEEGTELLWPVPVLLLRLRASRCLGNTSSIQ